MDRESRNRGKNILSWQHAPPLPFLMTSPPTAGLIFRAVRPGRFLFPAKGRTAGYLNIRRVTGKTQILPRDADARVKEFAERLLAAKKTHALSQIVVCDETSVVWYAVGKTTIENRGAKEVKCSPRTINRRQQHFYLQLCRSSGTKTAVTVKSPTSGTCPRSLSSGACRAQNPGGQHP